MARLTLVLSRHLDDAVLSCSSLMASRRSLIATFFTAGDASYEARRAEDFEAAKILGTSSRHLGFRDAPFRSVLYRSSASSPARLIPCSKSKRRSPAS